LVLVAIIVWLGAIPATASWFDNRSSVRGSGDVVEEDRDVEDIHGVELATIGTLYIEVGDEEALTIRGEDNLIEYIETDVRRGILTIDTERDVNLRTRKALKYFLTVKALDEIAISSSGDISAPDLSADNFTILISSSGDFEMGTLDCDDLEIEISSSGDVYIDELRAETIEVDISSSGDIEIGDGEVDRQQITISSSGDYNAKYLDSSEARVRINSSGDANVRVRDYLDARTNSSGDINYYGDPEDVDRSENSSGDVHRAGG
jgi:hypothetical protein